VSRRGDNLTDAELVAAVIGGDREGYGVLVDRHLGAVYSVVLRIVCNRSDAEDLAQDVFVRALQRLGQFGMEYSFRNWLLKIATNLAINHIRSRQRERLRFPRIAATQQQTADANNGGGPGFELPRAVDRQDAPADRQDAGPTTHRRDAGATLDARRDGELVAVDRRDAGATADASRNGDLVAADRQDAVATPAGVTAPAEWQPWLARLSESERTAIVLFHFQDMSYLQVAETLKVPLNTVRTLLHRGRRKLRELLTAAAPESGSWTVAI
jgi:RNA polymerase sigma factor (sigma-70 family)